MSDIVENYRCQICLYTYLYGQAFLKQKKTQDQDQLTIVDR